MKTQTRQNLEWSPTDKPVAPSSRPVGRNPEPTPPAMVGARVEGSIAGEATSRNVFRWAANIWGIRFHETEIHRSYPN